MLDPWIIEEIRRREEQERRHHEQPPSLELPLVESDERRRPVEHPSEKQERGIAIIDFSV